MDEWQQKINIVLSRGYSQHQYAHATAQGEKEITTAKNEHCTHSISESADDRHSTASDAK